MPRFNHRDHQAHKQVALYLQNFVPFVVKILIASYEWKERP